MYFDYSCRDSQASISSQPSESSDSSGDVSGCAHRLVKRGKQGGLLILRTLRTLFLFTKSDIKTTLLPIAIGGAVAAPVYSVRNFAEEFLWIWLHLLQFTTANQSCSLAAILEDSENKPDRPIPSGRMTLHQVRLLRWSLVPLCWWVSSYYGRSVLYSSVAVVAITYWYNELNGGGRHWLVRNLLNGIGFGAFECGAVLLAGRNRDEFDSIASRGILLSISLYATTTHTQDFKDVIGDKRIGRSTFALEMPVISRVSVLPGLVLWSLFLSKVWEMGPISSTTLIGLALLVGTRFNFMSGMHNDQVSFYWYNLWLSITYALPGICRFRFFL